MGNLGGTLGGRGSYFGDHVAQPKLPPGFSNKRGGGICGGSLAQPKLAHRSCLAITGTSKCSLLGKYILVRFSLMCFSFPLEGAGGRGPPLHQNWIL